MKVFNFESLEEAYPEIIKELLEKGNDVSPRGFLTKEISPATIVINNPRKRVIPSPIRKLNPGFMCGELLWILNGSNDVNFIGHYNKQWFNYSDDGSTLNGAYGDRIFNWDSGMRYIESTYTDIDNNTSPCVDCTEVRINQFEKAYQLLKSDPDTRQATIVFFDPYKDYTDTKDKPCTNLIRFMIRENKLNMTVFMRSNDIIFGTCYDIFNFTMLQEIMAGLLNVEVGKYTHIADSLHIYEQHFKLGEDIINEHYPLLYNNKCMDARMNYTDFINNMKFINDIEQLTRISCDFVKVENVVNVINKISNKYWQSIAALISTYNFRKAGKPDEDVQALKKYILNEFKDLEVVKNWKTLKKDK